jgi:hypothetical protein
MRRTRLAQAGSRSPVHCGPQTRRGRRASHAEFAPIASCVQRLRAGRAISESVLSHFNGLRRHFGPSSRGVAQPPPREPKGAVDFAALAFWATTTRQNQQNQRASFRRANRSVSHPGRKPLILLWTRIGHYAGLFLFEDLAPFVSRCSGASLPAPVRGASRPCPNSEKQ